MAQAFIWKGGILGSGPGLLCAMSKNPPNKKIMTVENFLLLGKPKLDHGQLQWDFLKPPKKCRVQGPAAQE